MKNFFKNYSYQSVSLFVIQIVISIFGLMLALAAGLAKNEVLKIVTGVFSALFFIFLQYGSAWRVGAEDRVSIDMGKKKLNLLIPVGLWLLSNSINLLLAIFVNLGLLFPNVSFFSSLGGISTGAFLLIEGVYVALLSIDVGGLPLNNYGIMFFVTTLPSFIAIFLGYWLGAKNATLFKLFLPSKPKG